VPGHIADRGAERDGEDDVVDPHVVHPAGDDATHATPDREGLRRMREKPVERSMQW
jgi:hypothetical protein